MIDDQRPGSPQFSSSTVSTGISFKGQHAHEIMSTLPPVGWFEVHPENYMVEGGPRHAALTALREQYPVSMHGVSLSLGGAEPVDSAQLAALKALIRRYQPMCVSDHLAWCKASGHYLPDLLPLPLNEESLQQVCDNIGRTQDALGQQIFVENPSSYLEFSQSDISEVEFLCAVASRTGCKLLLDVNNIYVSAENLGFSAQDYIDKVPPEIIGEVHLAGHALDTAAPERILIDDHGSKVTDEVWSLFARLYARIKSTQTVPVLVEWDTNVPTLEVLVNEAAKADQRISECR